MKDLTIVPHRRPFFPMIATSLLLCATLLGGCATQHTGSIPHTTPEHAHETSHTSASEDVEGRRATKRTAGATERALLTPHELNELALPVR